MGNYALVQDMSACNTVTMHNYRSWPDHHLQLHLKCTGSALLDFLFMLVLVSSTFHSRPNTLAVSVDLSLAAPQWPVGTLKPVIL